jgi:hypothetical protein
MDFVENSAVGKVMMAPAFYFRFQKYLQSQAITQSSSSSGAGFSLWGFVAAWRACAFDENPQAEACAT